MKELPPIFISHSSAPDEDQAALIQAIKDKFSADFEILLDQDLLQAGDKWRDELHTWMAFCRAGVVILSPGVVAKPDWVLKELTILTWRQSLDREFVLIPVLLPSVQRSNFSRNDFAPLLIGDLQMAKGGTAEIIAQLERRLKDVREREPTDIENLIDKIGGRLKPLKPDECRAIARKLAADPIGWDSRISEHELLARRMIHADFDLLCDVLIEKSVRIGADAACEILEWLFTFWINPEAVASIPKIAAGPHRAIAVNGSDPLTGRLYVRRAYCDYPPGRIAAPINNDRGELAVDDIENQLCDFFGNLDPALMREKNKQRVKRYLEKMGLDISGRPIFVVIDGLLPPQSLLTLQAKYPRFTFVLTSGKTLPAEDYYPSGSIHLLRPELDPDTEERCHIKLMETKTNIRQ